MKTTATPTMFRTIANPRRTTLSHLTDAAQLMEAPQPQASSEQPEHTVVLPAQTANPRRTVLMTVPTAGADGTPEEAAAH